MSIKTRLSPEEQLRIFTESLKESEMEKYVAIVLSICVFLGVLGYAQPTVAQEIKENKTEALLKYQAKKKEPWVGVGGALIFPSLGHAYAEDWWPRGGKIYWFIFGFSWIDG